MYMSTFFNILGLECCWGRKIEEAQGRAKGGRGERGHKTGLYLSGLLLENGEFLNSCLDIGL